MGVVVDDPHTEAEKEFLVKQTGAGDYAHALKVIELMRLWREEELQQKRRAAPKDDPFYPYC